MTTPSRAKEVERIRGRGAEGTVRGYLLARLREEMIRTAVLRPGSGAFPDPYWWDHPEEFARRILGVNPLPEQIEILHGVRDNVHVAIKGGRKVGKDFCLAILALAFYCAFPKSRVRFTATKEGQIDETFWREVRILIAGHGRCTYCKAHDPRGPKPCPHSATIEEEPGLQARTGIKCRQDFREIIGYTAKEAEGIAGLSGPYQLHIADEASAVNDFYFETIDGNIGGCIIARIVLISNPTRLQGAFYRAFHEEAATWCTFTRSSRLTPNVVQGRNVVQGLATREWLEMMTTKYEGDPAWIAVHIDGEFPQRVAGQIFTTHAIIESQRRWGMTPAVGTLHLGIDVAGESGTGDEGAFAVRRGLKMVALRTVRGLSADGYLVEGLGMIERFKGDHLEGLPRVIIDRGGEDGARVWRIFRDHLQEHWKAPPYELVGLFASDKAIRDPLTYDKVRDELAANLADWMRRGGAIPEDIKLSVELNQGFRWEERRIEERNRLVDKVRIRKELGRSPDRADACALATWGERVAPATAEAPAGGLTAIDPHEGHADQVFDPYSAMKAWKS